MVHISTGESNELTGTTGSILVGPIMSRGIDNAPKICDFTLIDVVQKEVAGAAAVLSGTFASTGFEIPTPRMQVINPFLS